MSNNTEKENIMFEQASRQPLRFDSSKGKVTVEDLWNLPLTELNVIAKALNKKIQEADEEDFIKEVSKEDATTKLKFGIVKHIITTLKVEAEQRKNAAATKAEANKLMELIAKKQEGALENLSVEELTARLAQLQK